MKAILEIIIAPTLALALAVCIVACGEGEEAEQTDDTSAVEATEEAAQTTDTEAQPLETIDNTPIELPLVP